jgi:hypothetical protein
VRREGFPPGTPVLVYLHAPREKVVGVLVDLHSAGVVLRGIDLVTFEDWLRQEARGERPELGLLTLFYPMNRVERIERDETLGGYEGFADRFRRATGRSLSDAASLSTRRRRR